MSVGTEKEEDVLEMVTEMEVDVDVDGEAVGGDVELLRAW